MNTHGRNDSSRNAKTFCSGTSRDVFRRALSGFWNLNGFVSKCAERFLESVHKQMIKYPERYPTEKQARVIDQIYDAALDEMAREGRYAFHMLPLRHTGRITEGEADLIAIPEDRPNALRIHRSVE